jgi:hypothetical protein
MDDLQVPLDKKNRFVPPIKGNPEKITSMKKGDEIEVERV